MKKHYLIIVVLLSIANYTFSQLTVTAIAAVPSVCLGNSTTIAASATPVTYTVTHIADASIPLDGTNILADHAAAIVPLSTGSLDDGRWDNITLPFTFYFYGLAYNSVNISTNGWIGMGSTNTVTSGFSATLPNAAAPNNVIHAITSDLTFGGAGNIAELEYFTSGTAPNRVFIVNYANVKFVSGTGTANVQVMLYEGSNIVEIHTDDCSNTGNLKAQGVENAAGTVAAVSTGRNNTGTWTGTPDAYRFAPDVINFSWSPATDLNTTSGANVISTPTANRTYTINATNASNGQTGSTTVSVSINAASYTLAGTAGGASVCQFISPNPAGSFYRDVNCNLIADVIPYGGSPVSNSINSCVKVDVNSTKRGTGIDLYLARQYDIEPLVAPATSTANVILYYKQTEFDNFNTRAADSGHKTLPTGSADATGISNLILRQFHGTGTNPLNYTGASVDFTTATSGFTVVWNSTRNWWEVTVPVNGFSGFYLTSKKAGTLAIALEYFKGTQIDKNNLLNWKVNCTSAKVILEVQRSPDGTHYTTINTVTADQARCSQPFDFTDTNPLSGANYYRLKITDVDGKSANSNIVLLTTKSTRFEMVSLAPNIVNMQNSILSITASERKEMNIVITDFSGRIVQKQTVQLQTGANQFTINTARLAAGAYHVSCYTNAEKPQSLSLIKQ